MPSPTKPGAGRGIQMVGCVFILSGLLFMFARNVAIGSSQIALGIVFIMVGGAHSRKAAAAAALSGKSDAPPPPPAEGMT